jgi:hypothetical protein
MSAQGFSPGFGIQEGPALKERSARCRQLESRAPILLPFQGMSQLKSVTQG